MIWTKTEIKTLRLRLGWTQSDLARRLQISTLAVDFWELGSNIPDQSLQRELEFLLKQASFCSDETRALPGAECECDSTAAGQVQLFASKVNSNK